MANGNGGSGAAIARWVGLALALIVWVFLAGGFYLKSNIAYDRAEEACTVAHDNELAIVSIQRDVDRLPSIEGKLDRLLERPPVAP